MSHVNVVTPLGEIFGFPLETEERRIIYCFLGIPYAKPPIGPLRFKDPVPIEPWTGIRSGLSSPPPAPTFFFVGEGRIRDNCSEDCLHVNVYTPKLPSKNNRYPVMVFIHGGSFTYGTGNEGAYGPDYLVPENIVLVTVNYRLGPFGFLTFETEECPGNYGLKDQSMAFRWVRNNISSFGGDPNNVTLFGESAGAASIQYHMVSPWSRGLFQKAILQSGSALNPWAYATKPKECAMMLAKHLGCESDDPEKALETIRNASMEDILYKSQNIYHLIQGDWNVANHIDCPFVPYLEPPNTPNAFLTEPVLKLMKAGKFDDIPIMAGVNSAETAYCLPAADYLPPWKNIYEIQECLPRNIGDYPRGSKNMLRAARSVQNFYFPHGATQESYIRATSASQFNFGVWKTMEMLLQHSSECAPKYLYYFNGGRKYSFMKTARKLTSVKGAAHSDELDYLFKVVDFEGAPPRTQTMTEQEKREQALLIRLWTKFARTGNPSEKWPTAETGAFAVLNEKLEVHQGFLAAEMNFWEDLYRSINRESSL